MGWFHTVKNPKIKTPKKISTLTPVGLWKKCTSCGEVFQKEKLTANLEVCPSCHHHYRIFVHERLEQVVDEGSAISHLTEICSNDPLSFSDKMSYKDRLNKAKDNFGTYDGTFAGLAKINGKQVALAIMDFHFMGGSMGVATGEKIAYTMDLAYEHKIPCIVFSASGGARMQEGILSLMQLAKTSASRGRLKEAKIPYISVLTDPTTGGCAASFAMQGDIIIAEPKALIGFAGPRVIEQSIRQTLPEGFQTSEFLLAHGLIDEIVPRHELKEALSFYINFLG